MSSSPYFEYLFPGHRDRLWLALWLTGMVIRLVILFSLMPASHEEWFVPFISHALSHPGLDPWGSHFAEAENLRAFPYGYPYILAFSPFVAVGESLGGLFGGHVGLSLAVLLFEVLLIAAASQLFVAESTQRWIYLLIWLNPLLIYANYVHGALDAFPVLLLMLSFVAFNAQRMVLCGLCFGLAMSAKFLAVLALPFFLIALWRDKRLQWAFLPFIAGLFLGALPFLLAMPQPGYQLMVLGTPEAEKVFSSRFDISTGQTLLMLPVALGLLALFAWRVARFNVYLVLVFAALVFLTLYLLTSAPPGWSVWVIALTSLAVFGQSTLTIAMTLLFFLFALAGYVLPPIGADTDFPGGGIEISSLIVSGKVATGILIFVEVVRRSIIDNPYYAATRKPIAIAIAGDSGAGKDTLSDSLGLLFGNNRSVLLSGDDYHVWDRRKPMWQAFTHLNPAANFLGAFFRDVESLLNQDSVLKREYDHATGKMTRPSVQNPKDVLIVSGLHALFNSRLNSSFDARIFLAMDERTRKALKIRRDVRRRGYSLAEARAALERREEDAIRFVLPQQSEADVVLQLSAVRETDLVWAETGQGEPEDELDMYLTVGVKDPEQATDLKRLLGSVLGVNTYTRGLSEGFTWLRIEQNVRVSRSAVKAASLIHMPSLRDFIAHDASWSSGVLGLMQLVVVDQAMRKRNIQLPKSEGAHGFSTIAVS